LGKYLHCVPLVVMTRQGILMLLGHLARSNKGKDVNQLLNKLWGLF